MLFTELGRRGGPGWAVPRGARGLALVSRASGGLQRCARALFRAARPRRGAKFQGARRDVYCCQEPREFAAYLSDSQLGTE